MGTLSTRTPRDLDRHPAVYEHPDAARLLSPDRTTVAVLESGSSIEALAGLAAIVVAIVGLTGHFPVAMSALATIALGVALVAQGGAVTARWRAALQRLDNARFDRDELIGGVGTEVFGGLVGCALGVLALAHVLPLLLVPVAAIVFGASLLLGGAAQPELAELVATSRREPTYRAVVASGGIMVLAGVAAAVLGILALLSVGPLVVLALIAMLAIACALTFAGGALTARLARYA